MTSEPESGNSTSPAHFEPDGTGTSPFRPSSHLNSFLDANRWDTARLAAALHSRYHVFHIRKPYYSASAEPRMRGQWERVLGSECVLMLSDARACVDVIMGVVAIVSGTACAISD